MKKLMLFLCCLIIGTAGFAGQGLAVPTGLELLLLVDVSGSVDSTEYNLQKNGYVNAFNDPDIGAAIATISGGIAVAYAEWSGSTQQSLEVGWTHLTNATQASDFATAISNANRDYFGSTAPGSAIKYGVPLFDNNGYEGSRLVIDISGDGVQNAGFNTLAEANAASAASITINGLPILTDDADLDDWYRTNITDPTGGFVVAASNFSDFAEAVKTKIGREITPTPEPATLLLLGLGVIGLAGLRRRMK
jgi:hypothetical protein